MQDGSKDFLTTNQAAERLCIGEDMFDEIVDDYSSWLKPRWFGKGKRRIKRWPVDGINALAYVLAHENETESEGASSAKIGS